MADENIIFRHPLCFKFISNKCKPQMLNYSLIQKTKEEKKIAILFRSIQIDRVFKYIFFTPTHVLTRRQILKRYKC